MIFPDPWLDGLRRELEQRSTAQWCRLCGNPLVLEWVATRYDRQTGKSIKTLRLRCPNSDPAVPTLLDPKPGEHDNYRMQAHDGKVEAVAW